MISKACKLFLRMGLPSPWTPYGHLVSYHAFFCHTKNTAVREQTTARKASRSPEALHNCSSKCFPSERHYYTFFSCRRTIWPQWWRKLFTLQEHVTIRGGELRSSYQFTLRSDHSSIMTCFGKLQRLEVPML